MVIEHLVVGRIGIASGKERTFAGLRLYLFEALFENQILRWGELGGFDLLIQFSQEFAVLAAVFN